MDTDKDNLLSGSKNKIYATFVKHIYNLYNVSESENDIENHFKNKSTDEIDDITLLWSLLERDIK